MDLTLAEMQLIEFALQSLPDHAGAQKLRKLFGDAIRAKTQGAHALQAADFVAPAPSHT